MAKITLLADFENSLKLILLCINCIIWGYVLYVYSDRSLETAAVCIALIGAGGLILLLELAVLAARGASWLFTKR